MNIKNVQLLQDLARRVTELEQELKTLKGAKNGKKKKGTNSEPNSGASSI